MPCAPMRTTVTLHPDIEALLRRRMRDRGVSFKQALKDAIREALVSPPSAALETATVDLALALEHGATIVTYDSDFGRCSGVAWREPAHLPG